jgi:Flp pilus assembly protein TadD
MLSLGKSGWGCSEMMGRKLILVGMLLLAAAACSPQGDKTMAAARSSDAATGQNPLGTWLRLGDAARAQGDLPTAISFYRRAADQYDTYLEPHLRLGSALAEMRAYNEAIAAYQSAVRVDPNSADAYRGWGNVLIALDQPQLAQAQYEAALKVAPNDHRTFNGLGVVRDLAGDHAGAQDYYRRGLALAPDHLPLQNNYGLSLALSGNYQESVRVLRGVAAHPSATARNRLNLALAYGLANQPDQAARAASADLDSVSVQRNLQHYAMLRSMDGVARSQAIRSDPTYFPKAAP